MSINLGGVAEDMIAEAESSILCQLNQVPSTPEHAEAMLSQLVDNAIPYANSITAMAGEGRELDIQFSKSMLNQYANSINKAYAACGETAKVEQAAWVSYALNILAKARIAVDK